MNSPDLVVAYLDLLYRHRELIAATYHQGRISESDGMAKPRGIQELRAQRTLVSLEQDSFRLNSSLGRHLDEALQKEQLFAAVGGNLADMAARLPWLVDEATKAYLEGRTDDLNDYVDTFDSAVYELADQIEQSLQMLRALTDTQFANVRTLAEKQRQNLWYIGRAERLGHTLQSLQGGEVMRRLDEDASAESLRSVFRTQIQDRLPEWRATLLEITEILKTYLYRLRQVEPAGRRLRAFHLFLRQHPDYALPALEEFPEPPEWATRPRAFRLGAHPDVNASALDEPLAKIAAALPNVASTLRKPAPTIGTLVPDDASPAVLTIALRAHQAAFQRFLDAIPASGHPLSSLAWKRAQPEEDGLTETLWLHCVYHETTLARPRISHLQWDIIEHPYPHPLSGNLIVQDILVRRAS